MSGQELIAMSMWAIAGGVATRALPQIIMPNQNTGFMGYAANAVTAGVLAWGADRFIGGNSGRGVLIGGMVMLAGRVISDLFGKSLVSFGDIFGTTGTSGLGAHGDPSFDLGVYTPGEFVVPTWSDGLMQTQDYPFLGPSAAFPPGAHGKGYSSIATPAGPVMVPTVATPAGPVPATPAAAATAAKMSGLGFASTGRLRSRFAA